AMIIQTRIAPRESLRRTNCSVLPLEMGPWKDFFFVSEFGFAGLPGMGPVAARKSLVRESLMTPVLRPARPVASKGSSGRWLRVERDACKLPVGKSACVLKAAATGGTTSFPVITP